MTDFPNVVGVPAAATFAPYPGDPDKADFTLGFNEYIAKRWPEVKDCKDAHVISQFVIRLATRANSFEEKVQVLNFARNRQMYLNGAARIALRPLAKSVFETDQSLRASLSCYIFYTDQNDTQEMAIRARIIELIGNDIATLVKANILLISPLGRWLVEKVVELNIMELYIDLFVCAVAQKNNVVAQRSLTEASKLCADWNLLHSMAKAVGWKNVQLSPELTAKLIANVPNIPDAVRLSVFAKSEEDLAKLRYVIMQLPSDLAEVIYWHNKIAKDATNNRLSTTLRWKAKQYCKGFAEIRVCLESLDFSEAPAEAKIDFCDMLALQACELKEIGWALRMATKEHFKEVADKLPTAQGSLQDLVESFNDFALAEPKADSETEIKLITDTIQDEYLKKAKDMCREDKNAWLYIASYAKEGSCLHDEARVKIGMERPAS